MEQRSFSREFRSKRLGSCASGASNAAQRFAAAALAASRTVSSPRTLRNTSVAAMLEKPLAQPVLKAGEQLGPLRRPEWHDAARRHVVLCRMMAAAQPGWGPAIDYVAAIYHQHLVARSTRGWCVSSPRIRTARTVPAA